MSCYESQDVTGSAERVTETPEMLHDTREKLEEDVRKHYAYSTTTLMCPPSANKTTDMLGALPVDTVIGWLDRQAAITEREFFETACQGCERLGGDGGPTLDELCDELRKYIVKTDRLGAALDERDAQLADAQEALDVAWSERDQWRDAYEDSERMRLELIEELEKRDKGIRRLKQRRGELMEQVRMLQDDAARARREA